MTDNPIYPIILIPEAIQVAAVALPPIPEFKELAPPAPRNEPQPINVSLIASVAIGVIGVCFALVAANMSVAAGVTFAVGLVGVIFHALSERRTYSRRRFDWEKECRNYENKLKRYNQRKLNYHQKSKILQTPEKIAEYRQNRLAETLSNTQEADGINNNAQRGYSESDFGVHLNRYFPSKIHTAQCFKIPGFKYPYTADFAYIDIKINFMIDIEIDEPYAYKNKRLTHYIGADDKRNKFFLERNWIVIRFAEEQVVSYPKGCCKVIADVIQTYTSTPIPKALINESLPEIKQWTVDDAEQMAKQNYRNRYLKK